MKAVASLLFVMAAILTSHVAYATTCWTGIDGDMGQVPCSPGINDGDGGRGGFGIGYECPSPGSGGGAPVGGRADVLKVDGQSAASTRQSIEAMKKGMSGAQRKAFSDAIYKIRINNPKAGHDSRRNGPNVLIDDAALGEWIDGMTAGQIIKLGSELPEATIDKP